MKKLFLCLLAVMLFSSAALAESATLEGTVVSLQSAAVLAPAAGTVSQVLVSPGARVTAGQEVAQMAETIVYAEKAGTVKVFGKAGDSVATLSDRYGGVLYLEADYPYTASVSSGYAYDSIETEIVHPGETVYLRGINYGEEGVAVITGINGNKFSIEVTEGVFHQGEYAYVFRSPDFASTSRLGRGAITFEDAVAYTNTSGTGIVTRIFVADGAHVEEGDPLFATLEANVGEQWLSSAVNGIVASVSANPGDTVEQGALIATIHPNSAMRLEVLAEEYDLKGITVGQAVTISFANGMSVEGTVESFGGIQYVEEETTTDTEEEEDEEEEIAYFSIYIAFTPTEAIAYGMTGEVSFGE